MARWSDDEIVQGLQDPTRRPEAFRALVAQYAVPLRGFLQNKCDGDPERAEDLLGPVLCKAYWGLMKLKEPCGSLKRWLYTIANRTALDDLRKKSKDPLDGALELQEELVEAHVAPQSHERSEVEQERDAAVAALLAQLAEKDPRYRTLLEMEYVAACSRDEIAQATGIEKRQIAPYLKRAKEYAAKLARANPILAAWEQALERRQDRD